MESGNFEKTLDSVKQIEITTTSRRSGHEISNPVWFVRRGGKLYLLPVGGSGSQWYKNLLKTPTIHLTASRTEYSGSAKPITDATQVNGVVEDFRGKYGPGNVTKFYPDPDVAIEVAPG